MSARGICTRIAAVSLCLCLGVAQARAWTTPTNFTALPDYEVGTRAGRDSAGNIHLVWYGGAPDSSGWRMFYQMFNGSTWSAPEAVSGTGAGGPDIAVDGNNDLHVVWNAPGNPEEIYYRKRTAGVWSATVNLSNSGNRSLTPRIAVSSAGTDILVTWHESAQTGGDWDILARRFSGGAWGAIENVSADSTLSRTADVVRDAAGAYHIAWEDLGSNNLFYRKRNADGTYGSKTALDTTSGRSFGAALAISANGYIHAAWHDDNSDWDIWYRYFNGTSWSAPVNIANHPDPDHADNTPSIETDANNEVHVVWHDYQNVHYAHTVGGVWRPRYVIGPGSVSGQPYIVRGAGSALHCIYPNRDAGTWDAWHTIQAMPDTTAPNPVANFRAYPTSGQVRLDWSNPSAQDFIGVTIRWKTGSFPTSRTDGNLLTNVTGGATTATHRGLTNGVTYYYAAFAYDAEPNYSGAAQVSAVPISAPKTNLLVNPGMTNFTSGVANGWTSYRANASAAALTFGGDTTNVDSATASQGIFGIDSASLPTTSYSAAGLYQVVTNVRPGAVYLFVGYQDIHTTDFGADGHRYIHNFGISPLGSTSVGTSYSLGIVGDARWMGYQQFWNDNAGSASFFGGFHRARAAAVGQSNRLSVWTGIAINNAGARDNVPAKFNADTHYLFEFDFPTNNALLNGDFEGEVTDLQDGGDAIPEDWLPIGGGVGQVNSWAVATNFANVQDGSDRGLRVWSRRGMVNAGVMQRVATAPGQAVTFSAWARASGQDNTECSVGIDPFGRAEIASFDIVWVRSASTAWTQLVVSAAAQGNAVTVFLRTQSSQGGGNYQWSDFDDATLIGGGTPSAVILPTGSFWKYQPVFAYPAANWHTGAYDDSAWPSGPAQLGVGDGDEATVVLPIQDGQGNQNITTLFRRPFVVTNAARYTNLIVRLLRDDGGVVYLNGVEVFRSNLPQGPIATTNLALYNVSAPEEINVFFSTNAPGSPLVEGTNLLAVEIHQASLVSGDMSFDLELIGIIDTGFAPNQPPAVSLTGPAPGAVFSAGTTVLLSADAFDPDGEVTKVEFLVNGAKVGESTFSPFSFAWSNSAAGYFTLTARATDDSGATTMSAPVRLNLGVATLVSTGAVWRYLDDQTDQGTIWVELNFDDSGWSNGVAQLGFGDGDEATVFRQTFPGAPGSGYIITAYFRRAFVVPNPSDVTNLLVRLLRDDGGLVYLNGVEIFRSNLPVGPISNNTFAVNSVATGPDESTNFYSTNASAALLVSGTNMLAAEIHQVNLSSTDMSFDLELQALTQPAPPRLTISWVGPTLLHVRWPSTAVGFTLYAAEEPDGTGGWQRVFVPVGNDGVWNSALVSAAGASRFFRLSNE